MAPPAPPPRPHRAAGAPAPRSVSADAQPAVCRCRASRVDDRVDGMAVRQVRAVLLGKRELQHLHPRESQLVQESRHVRRDQSEVLRDERQRAQRGAAASKRARPGPSAQRPFNAVGSPAGTSQNDANPRKWSIARRRPTQVRAQALDPPRPAVARRGGPTGRRDIPTAVPSSRNSPAARPRRAPAGRRRRARRDPGAPRRRRCRERRRSGGRRRSRFRARGSRRTRDHCRKKRNCESSANAISSDELACRAVPEPRDRGAARRGSHRIHAAAARAGLSEREERPVGEPAGAAPGARGTPRAPTERGRRRGPKSLERAPEEPFFPPSRPEVGARPRPEPCGGLDLASRRPQPPFFDEKLRGTNAGFPANAEAPPYGRVTGSRGAERQHLPERLSRRARPSRENGSRTGRGLRLGKVPAERRRGAGSPAARDRRQARGPPSGHRHPRASERT